MTESGLKTYIRVWWRGIGVIGLYIWLSLVVAVLGLLVEALPERIQMFVGIPLLILAVPPLLYWAFRWIYPEIDLVKTRFTRPHKRP
jgi:hypothetical protein